MALSEKNPETVVPDEHAVTEEKENANSSNEETIIQVKVSSPGGDEVNLSINTNELVQEIHRALIDREETCHRTCFSLYYENQTLDLFTELKSIPNLKDGAEFKVVEERYSQREVRTHVKQLHDLIRSIDFTDCYLGKDQLSLCFLPTILETDDLFESQAKSGVDKISLRPPEFLIPKMVNDPVPLLPLHPLKKELSAVHCLKQLNYSNWNPPHTQRKLAGDLLYLYVHTLEEKRFHITACPRGFFVNQSTNDVFNHKPVPGYQIYHSLVDLLKKISPGFKKNFESILKKRASKSPLERMPTPYQKFSWLSPILDHESNSIRKEESMCSRLASDENLPGQPRDWNEELQMSRELNKASINERLLRDRSIFKTNSDFIIAASRAAVSIVNGDILAINPGEHRKQQMYIWNNMFFSYGFDIKDHYKEFGGEAAAHAATSSDLNGIRAYSLFDHSDLHTLGTAIIDFRGYRVTAQTIIPGILEKEQEKLVVYGSIDFGKTVVTDARYEAVLEKSSKHLKIRPHEVLNESDKAMKLYSSVDCKGIVGNDSRVYILDLLRTFPPDLNYFGSLEKEQLPELSDALKERGYPYKHPHLMSTLRQELVEAFSEHKREEFYKIVLTEYERLKPVEEKKKPETSENETNSAGELDKNTVMKQLVQSRNVLQEVHSIETASEPVKEAVRIAAKAIGSLTDNSCEIAFNPDVYHQFVKFPADATDEINTDKKMLLEACEFLVCEQIPRFIKDLESHVLIPQDGQSLVDTLHQKGINVRYLNRIVSELETRPRLCYVKRIAVCEILVRSIKHLFRSYMQDVDQSFLSAALAHFLNCIFTTASNLNPLLGADEYAVKLIRSCNLGQNKAQKKHKKKSGGAKNRGDLSNEELYWTQESPASLWASIARECDEYFHFSIEADSIDAFINKNGISRLSLLRSVCQTTGIQLALKDYPLFHNGPSQKALFTVDDVVNIFPVVKHLHPIATDAYQYYTTGQARVSSGNIQEGLALITEASELLTAVYGPLHPDTCACNRLLARLYYILGDHQTACLYQQRATIIAERVHGIDSPNSANEYLYLSIYSFACGHLPSALKSLYRARHICLVCHGEEHPEVAQIDTNIGLMLLVLEEFDLAALYLENAKRLNRIFYGENSLKEAFNCHLVSRAHVYRGDYRKALQFEKLRHSIYQERLGPENDYTKDSDECMKMLLSQALNQARKAQKESAASDHQSALTNGVVNGIKASCENTDPSLAGGKAVDKINFPLGSRKGKESKLLAQSLPNYNLLEDSSPFVMAGGARSMFQFPNLVTILDTINRVNGIFVIKYHSNALKMDSKSDVDESQAALVDDQELD